jgi:hypothetical protein
MIGTLVIAAAAAVDGLATGVWIGKKWGTKVTTMVLAPAPAALTQAGSTLKTDVTKVEAAVAPTVTIAAADLKALLAHFETVSAVSPAAPPAPVVAPVAPVVAPVAPVVAPVATEASIKALLAQLAPK